MGVRHAAYNIGELELVHWHLENKDSMTSTVVVKYIYQPHSDICRHSVGYVLYRSSPN